jgi:hypothetical protein
MTIGEALLLHPMPEYLAFICEISTEDDSYYVLRSDNWDLFPIPENATCSFISYASGTSGGGKKNPVALILMLVVVAALSYFSGGTTLALTPALGASLAGAVVAVGSGLILAGAAYLINMALPPTFPKGPEAPDPAYSIIGRSNQARLGAPQEVGFGYTKWFPSLCAAPYREFSDSFAESAFDSQAVGDQTLFEVYMAGEGYYDFDAYDLLNQDVDTFGEIVVQKFEPGEQVNSFPSSVVDVPAVADIFLKFALGDSLTGGTATVGTLYDGSDLVNEQQIITVENYASGTFKVEMEGVPTASIERDESVESFKTKLEAIPSIGSGNTRVTLYAVSDTSRTWGVEFINDLARVPLAQMTIDATDLVDTERIYPNWGNIPFAGYDLITESGVVGDRAYLKVDGADFGIEDALVGMLVVFAPANTVVDGVDTFNDFLACATIAASTTDTIYWDIPLAPSTLLNRQNNEPIIARIAADAEETNGDIAEGRRPPTIELESCFFQVLELKNWMGPYKVNPDESSDLVNQIAFDIVMPEGRYLKNDNGHPLDIGLGWRAEIRELDDNGEPIDGTWKPATTDPKYLYIREDSYFGGGPVVSNITVSGYSVSPTRFTVKVPVPDGRYEARVANCFRLNMLFSGSTTDTKEWEIPGGYQPNGSDAIGNGNSFNDLEKGRGVYGKSYWSGLRGYGTRQSLSWEDRTIVTLRVTATDNVNGSTLQAFGIRGCRKLQDYVGAVDSGMLPSNPLTTTIFSGVRVAGPTVNVNVPLSRKESVVAVTGIGAEFRKGDYVRLSGFSGDSAKNNGEFLVLKSADNSLTIRGDLATVPADPAQVAGSRKIRGTAPTVLDSVAVTDTHEITKTGIGLLDDFAPGSKVTLSGFVASANNKKFNVESVTANTVTVTETLVVETAAPGKKAHSVPPNGLIGALLDNLPAVLADAESVGGIDADAINTAVIDGIEIVVSSDLPPITTIAKTGIAALVEAILGEGNVLGARITLGGFSQQRNQGGAVITAVADDALTVALPVASEHDPVPVRSYFVTEAAGAGKRLLLGAREIIRTGDTSFYFYADQGATSAATGGGTAVSYSFPNVWTGLVRSRRISSAAYSLATDRNYGGGSDGSRVDLQGLRARETTWDSRDRYKSDGITWKEKPIRDCYDARLSERKLIQDHFTEMARCGRARPMYPSGRFTFIRDEPRPVADDMFVGGCGMNIGTDSLEFVSTFPTEDTPDHVLVQFFNEEFWDFDEVVCTTVPYSLSQLISVFHVSGGTMILNFLDQDTAPIAAVSTASEIQAALETLEGVEADTLVCTAGTLTVGPVFTTYTVLVTYAGSLLGKNVSLIKVKGREIIGGSAHVTFNINDAWPGVAPARLVMPGIVQRQQAWREGMYELGSSRARRMLTSWNTDVEGLIPSYLSRVDVCDEVLGKGQQGIVLDYVDKGTYFSLLLSEPLIWTEGDHVVQLRDKFGKPSTDALTYVTQGALPNEAIIALGDGFDTEVIGLHTDHQVGREATFFSFGPVDDHSLQLLVTGVRPTASNSVSIEAYIYKVEGVYDIDGDLDYVPPNEAEILDARQVGNTIDGLHAYLQRLTVGDTVLALVHAAWTPAPWATHYLVETSIDGGFTWAKIAKTTNSRYNFEPEDISVKDQVIANDFTCGSIISPVVTVIARHAATETTPWIAGQFDGKSLQFNTGVYAGQRFRIAQTYVSGSLNLLFLESILDPSPDAGTDTYDIITQVAPTLTLSVRGYNGLYGPRSLVNVDLTLAGTGIQAPVNKTVNIVIYPGVPDVSQPYQIETETQRSDYYGNLFLAGKLFDADHPTRYFYCGAEPRYDGADLSVAYLPSEPRRFLQEQDIGRDSILLFLQDSLIEQVTSSPGNNQWMRVGTKIQLGFDRDSREHLHFIMVSANDDGEILSGIKVGENCTFTPGSSAAVLPFVPARPEEVLLFLNGDVLFLHATPGIGQFSLSGTAITTGFTLEAGDQLLALGLSDDGKTEAYRFHCAPFSADMIPYLPLFPKQCAIAQGATMRWQAPGVGNFKFNTNASPQTVIDWENPQPAAGEIKYIIMLRARAGLGAV